MTPHERGVPSVDAQHLVGTPHSLRLVRSPRSPRWRRGLVRCTRRRESPRRVGVSGLLGSRAPVPARARVGADRRLSTTPHDARAPPRARRRGRPRRPRRRGVRTVAGDPRAPLDPRRHRLALLPRGPDDRRPRGARAASDDTPRDRRAPVPRDRGSMCARPHARHRPARAPGRVRAGGHPAEPARVHDRRRALARRDAHDHAPATVGRGGRSPGRADGSPGHEEPRADRRTPRARLGLRGHLRPREPPRRPLAQRALHTRAPLRGAHGRLGPDRRGRRAPAPARRPAVEQSRIRRDGHLGRPHVTQRRAERDARAEHPLRPLQRARRRLSLGRLATARGQRACLCPSRRGVAHARDRRADGRRGGLVSRRARP